jgi:hypothetical protein
MTDRMETDVEYTVLYQKRGDPTWWIHMHKEYKHPTGHWSTKDYEEAHDVAAGLLDRRYFTDSRPKYQARVTATQVHQTIHTGGVIITFGDLVEGPRNR